MVQMNGDGFKLLAAQDDEVKKGQKLIEFDIDKIKAAGHPDTVIVAITNGFDYTDVKKSV